MFSLMWGENTRILREQDSIEKMIIIYCEAKHRTRMGLCDDCDRLLKYAQQRLQRCIFGEDKPVCAKCPVHCYRQIMRDKIIAVMRYSGPRMIYKHPILAVLHLIDSVKNTSKLAITASGSKECKKYNRKILIDKTVRKVYIQDKTTGVYAH